MSTPVIEFIGIYDADATLRGEISYWIGARLGIAHCALCDITHGLFTQKDEWKQCREALTVPFRAFHRNDAPADALATAAGAFPVVLARTEDGLDVVLGPEELDQFEGSAARFTAWLTGHLESRQG